MSWDFLNEVEFDKKVRVPENLRAKTKSHIPKKIWVLILYISLILGLMFGGKYAFESVVGLCLYSKHHMSWQEIKEKFKPEKRIEEED